MPGALDHEQLRRDLHRILRRGPASSRELTAALRISQPTLSRLLRASTDQVVAFGRARRTRYAARRPLPEVGQGPFPVYELAGPGHDTRHLLDLYPTQPTGFVVRGRAPGVVDTHVPDLPWYLQDLRPSGFLGRLLPRRHPELGLPSDVRIWSSDHVLRYLVRHGWDAPGAFVVGEEAMAKLLSRAGRPSVSVGGSERGPAYQRLAADVLLHGGAGSSAAGEQPKFLAVRDGVPVLVKFSPVVDHPVAQRVADVLVAEHLALQTLHDVGHSAARSEVVQHGGRVYLEVERFDRVGLLRRGVVSLFTLDAEHVGSLLSWADSAARLGELGLISPDDVERVCWRQAFGELIGNNDMHLHNLSFFLDGLQLDSLAPAYDMAPMRFAPRAGDLLEVELSPRISPELARTWPSAREAALRFWQRVVDDERISAGFRDLAQHSLSVVEGLEGALRLMPDRGRPRR